jgi:hypothetical protein
MLQTIQKLIYEKIRSSMILYRVFFKFCFCFNRFRIRLCSALGCKQLPLFKVDFLINTKCTLKCKDCCCYIPSLKNENHYEMNFENFKLYLDNVLANVSSVYTCSIMGGEPLLNKDLDKILTYTSQQKKLNHIFLVTNGTIDFPDNIVEILRNSKIGVYISDYSSNQDLQGRLKIESITEKLNKNSIPIHTNRNLAWFPLEPIKHHRRSIKENRKYYLKCANHCAGIVADKLVPCTLMGIFALMNIGVFRQNLEYIDVSKDVLSKEQIAKLFLNSDFEACQFCSRWDGLNEKSVKPAIQL